MLQRNVGSLDGQQMIQLNNIAVGYFPTESPEISVYPLPQPQPEQQPQPVVEPNLEKNF
jgi:hypothetical protein